MNTNTTRPNNRNEDDNKHLYGMRKITYWEKYGVKRFPYRGSRRHTPILQQHFDGRISISNDLFGLTIHQFEKEFKACLERRKENSQFILNLRYPAKSSDEYREYLKNCIDPEEGFLVWSNKDSQEKFINEKLIQIVGTEIDIRHKQRLFLIHDVIANIILDGLGSHVTYISSGSLSEGLSLPGSDYDIMFILNTIKVIESKQKQKYSVRYPTLLMEEDPVYPGFIKLRVFNTQYKQIKKLITETDEGSFLEPDSFIKILKNETPFNFYVRGSCISDTESNMDGALCLHCKSFPSNARQWFYRQRKQWPPNSIIDIIKRYGCLCVPIGPKAMTIDNLLWRISFSVAEKQLVHSFNYTQLVCYNLLKLTLKHIINEKPGVKDLLCSYFMKTALFWVSEEVSIETFHLDNLFHCFGLCLNKLKSWIEICHCPNYFIPEQNMFQGKVNTCNNQRLLSVIDGIICDGTIKLTYYEFSSGLNYTTENISSFQIDFLFYNIFANPTDNPKNIRGCYQGLVNIKSLLESESSEYVRDICRRWICKIHQYILQQLPSPVKIRNKYHKHFQEAIKHDAVTGWLLYASFYYGIRQYNVTLRITDYVLSRCTPDKIYPGVLPYHKNIIDKYAKHFNSKSITLNEKLKLATIASVPYLQRSSLIPEELQLEIEKGIITIPAVVLSHFLTCLCYYRIGDISNQNEALSNLSVTVREKYLIAADSFPLSLTILGLCYELSGHGYAALECYDDALRCEDGICKTTEIRKTNLSNKLDYTDHWLGFIVCFLLIILFYELMKLIVCISVNIDDAISHRIDFDGYN